jgi:hypothetical protein
MTTLKKQNNLLSILVTILSLLLAVSIIVGALLFIKGRTSGSEGKICMKESEYRSIVSKENSKGTLQNERHERHVSHVTPTHSDERDRRVLSDPLYPALNRSEYGVHNSTMSAIARKELYNTTQEFTDRYRLVGYVTNSSENKDVGGNSWKLMARNKDKNRAEFYMIPTNNNYDMKIMLNNDIVTGEKLRDVYTIPKQLVFKSPLLNESAYEVTELPMNDFTNFYD